MGFNTAKTIRRNLRLSRLRYGSLNSFTKSNLKALTRQFGFSVESGDLLLLDGSWYVTHTGLLRLATRRRCAGMAVEPVPAFCVPAESKWAFQATVFKSASCKGFVGFGDAEPANVSATVLGAVMRVAETRAVNRALRKAYGIGLCSVEEVGTFTPPAAPAVANTIDDSRNGQHLRDRLLVLIRQHRLDAALVKLYAVDYCGTTELRLATREKMREFIEHLTQLARNDAAALQKILHSYAETNAGAAA